MFRNSAVLEACWLTPQDHAANIDVEMLHDSPSVLLVLVADWLQRQPAGQRPSNLKAENRMLRDRLGGRRISFTDAERRQLAEKANAGTRGATRAWHDRHARYAASVAPGICGAQMGASKPGEEIMDVNLDAVADAVCRLALHGQ